jgi:pilus assembly protein Flp/PilA
MKNKKSSSFRNLVRATRGANMVEYIILVGIVALIAIGGFGFFGDQVKERIHTQGATVSKVNADRGPE